MESARLLELAIAIHIHGQPRPVPRLNLYFDGTQVTRSFAAFGSSYAPEDSDQLICMHHPRAVAINTMQVRTQNFHRFDYKLHL